MALCAFSVLQYTIKSHITREKLPSNTVRFHNFSLCGSPLLDAWKKLQNYNRNTKKSFFHLGFSTSVITSDQCISS